MYDASQLKTEEDDEKAPESQYATLLAPAATDVGAPTAAPPAPAAPKAKGSGFVNFERYANANKGVVDNQKASRQAAVDSRYAALQTGLQGAQDVETPSLQGPAADTAIVDDPSLKGPRESLSGGPVVTRDEAMTNASAAYTGPTQQDIDSKYAALTADKNRLTEEANAAKSGYYTGNRFDDSLLGSAGGVDYSKTKSLENQFKESYGNASKAVGDASQNFETARSAWDTLLHNHDTTGEGYTGRVAAEKAEANAQTASNIKIETDRKLGATLDAFSAKFGAGAAKDLAPVIDRMSFEQRVHFANMDPKSPNYPIELTKLISETLRSDPMALQMYQMYGASGLNAYTQSKKPGTGAKTGAVRGASIPKR